MAHDLLRRIFPGSVLFIFLAGPAAASSPSVQLTLRDHKFTPNHVMVQTGERFKIFVTNNDTTPDEFESSALRVEKIVVPGQTITVFAGPLTPGTYAFYDDYHPETAHGVVEAK
jgi:heme/copper-type cytochrome/quinol oxidase subunit 2